MRYFTWMLEFVSNNLWLILSGNSFLLVIQPRPLVNDFLTVLATLESLTQFGSKFRATNLQKRSDLHQGRNFVLKSFQP